MHGFSCTPPPLSQARHTICQCSFLKIASLTLFLDVFLWDVDEQASLAMCGKHLKSRRICRRGRRICGVRPKWSHHKKGTTVARLTTTATAMTTATMTATMATAVTATMTTAAAAATATTTTTTMATTTTRTTAMQQHNTAT